MTANNLVKIGFIGDVHAAPVALGNMADAVTNNNFDHYLQICRYFDHTIQLGDFGFNPAYSLLAKSGLNSANHVILGGNHDDYTNEYDTATRKHMFFNQTAHFLGDYGVHVISRTHDKRFVPELEQLRLNTATGADLRIFYVRGGRSIDRATRIHGVDWWPEEELSASHMIDALMAYTAEKPRIVVSHECPAFMIENLIPEPKIYNGAVVKPSNTAKMLEQMWKKHQPDLWIFGHHHLSNGIKYEDTLFVCVDKLHVASIGW